MTGHINDALRGFAEEKSLYTSTARTATPTAATFTTDGHTGLRIVIDATASAATPSVVPTIDFYDALSGTWSTLLTGAAITGTGTTVLQIGPGVTAANNVSVAGLLPLNLRLVMTHADSDSITYTAAVHLIG
jgi:hypothetical protein